MRPWVISFLIVALAVGGTLYLLPDKVAEDPEPKKEAAGLQVLSRESVESYILIQPQIDAIFAASGQAGGADNAEKVYALLQKHGLSRSSYDRIRRSVEASVTLMRRAQNQTRVDAELDRQIQLKEAALDGASDSIRASLELDLAKLRKLRAEGTIINESDRALMQRYWTDLDRIAPHVR